MAEITITAQVWWVRTPNVVTATHPLRNVFCMLTVVAIVPYITHGYLDDDGCIKIKVDSKNLDLMKQLGQKVYAVINLMPNTKDCSVVYRENSKDKYNSVILQEEINLEDKKVDFSFHLSPLKGYEYPNDPKTFTEQCDRRRLVVASIMQFGARFIRSRLNKIPCHVKCYYPKRYDVVDTSYALVSIHLGEEDYLSPRTILHEYGHKCYGMYRTYTRIPIADHSGEVDLTAGHPKTRGIYTAFIEGFAHYFSYRVLSTYVEYLKEFDGVTAAIEESEYNRSQAPVCGEANEDSIANLLIDMSDPINEKEETYINTTERSVFGNWLVRHEELSISDKAIVELIAEQDDQNLYSYCQAFYKKYPQHTEAFNNILSMQGIAPSDVYAMSIDDEKVLIGWKAGGTLESQYYDDDKLSEDKKICKTYQRLFDVKIYDAKFNHLETYVSEGGLCITSFPYETIKDLNKESNYFLIKIKGYCLYRPRTEYESSYFRINLESYSTDKELVIIPSILNKITSGHKTSYTIGNDSMEILHYDCSYDDYCNMFMVDEYSRFEVNFNDNKFTRVQVTMTDRPTGRYIAEKYFLEVEYNNGKKEKVQLDSKKTTLGKNNSTDYIKKATIDGEYLDERLLKIVRIKFLKNTLPPRGIDSILNPKGPKPHIHIRKNGKSPKKAKKQ